MPEIRHDPEVAAFAQLSMSHVRRPRCTHCGEQVSMVPGGWAYRYTQILLHLDRCMAVATEHERQATARQLAGGG